MSNTRTRKIISGIGGHLRDLGVEIEQCATEIWDEMNDNGEYYSNDNDYAELREVVNKKITKILDYIHEQEMNSRLK